MNHEHPARIIFNDDTCSLRFVDGPHTLDRLEAAVGHLRGSQVDCLCWCLYSGDIAYSWPSACCDNYFELSHRHALKDKFRDSRNLMLSLHERGIDYLPALIERVRAAGLEFYGSFRMNDAHQKSVPDSYLASEFWRNHPEYRLWEVTDGKTYYNATLDYSYAEVRQRKLDAIAEVLDWYDVDGIELDWCRNPYAFQPSEAWSKRQILTDFTATVRQMVTEAAEKRGTSLGLMVRVPFSEEKRRLAGMDIEAWMAAGLVDVMVMSDHVNDLNRALGEWPERCRHHNVLFYPSVESGPAANAAHNHVVPETAEESIQRQRGAAQNFLAQGCAGIYMFNYPCKLFEHSRSDREFEAMAAVLGQIGKLDTLRGHPKEFTYWAELPLQLESCRPARYHQTIRFALRDRNALSDANRMVTLRFRQVAERNPHAFGSYWQQPIMPPDWVVMSLNGWQVPAEAVTRQQAPKVQIPSGFSLRRHEIVEIRIPAGHLHDGINELAFHVPRTPQARDPYIYIYELVVNV